MNPDLINGPDVSADPPASMRILVTAGNTQVPIDRVRCITNIFTGRSGAMIALRAHERGHRVTLLTSHPEAAEELARTSGTLTDRWVLERYRTFDDLHKRMQTMVQAGELDALVHCAAVSDFRVDGVYAPAPGTTFDAASGVWAGGSQLPILLDCQAGKVKSDRPEVWLRLRRTPKLVDLVRAEWGFRGLLVKFKLEVDVGEQQLLDIAEQSRRHSSADLMVANTLEGAAYWAYLGPLQGRYDRVSRRELPERLLEALASLRRGGANA